MTEEQRPPTWLVERVAYWRDALGLWQVGISVQLGDMDSRAEAYPSPDLNSARIIFPTAVAAQEGPDPDLDTTIIHELLHVALMGITDAWAPDVLGHLGQQAAAVAVDWLHRVTEAAVEGLAQAIYKLAEGGNDG